MTGQKPFRIARAGMVRTFQIVQPFAGQSVRENIAVGAHLHLADRGAALAKAEEVADAVGLADRLDRDASDLTVAGSKRLEVARALATEPKLMLLDEVMAGLNPSEIRDVIPLIRAIRDRGITILLIEHVMQAVMELSDHAWVLNQGATDRRGRAAQARRRSGGDRGLSRQGHGGAHGCRGAPMLEVQRSQGRIRPRRGAARRRR